MNIAFFFMLSEHLFLLVSNHDICQHFQTLMTPNPCICGLGNGHNAEYYRLNVL